MCQLVPPHCQQPANCIISRIMWPPFPATSGKLSYPSKEEAIFSWTKDKDQGRIIGDELMDTLIQSCIIKSIGGSMVPLCIPCFPWKSKIISFLGN